MLLFTRGSKACSATTSRYKIVWLRSWSAFSSESTDKYMISILLVSLGLDRFSLEFSFLTTLAIDWMASLKKSIAMSVIEGTGGDILVGRV